MIVGGLTIIYAAFYVDTFSYNIAVGGLDSEPNYVRGQTPYQKLVIGFIGLIIIYSGYRSYRFIPYAEREKELVSEMDLSEDEI
jgi:hypothetical protein